MSYILDALRKSEEARRRQQGPDLSLAGSAPPPEQQRSSWALPLLALALLVNGAVLAIWLWRAGEQEPVQTVAEAVPWALGGEASQTVAPSPQTPAAPPSPSAPLPAPLPTPSPGPETSAAVANSELDWRQQPVRRIDDLTPSSRSRLPRLAISTHIYADEPSFREVSINGRRYREGDSVAGLALLEITETGVLMGFEEQVIRLDLQDEWDL